MKKFIQGLWAERIFLALIANAAVLVWIGVVISEKDVNVDVAGGISQEEMSSLLEKGIDVHLTQIAGEDLTFDTNLTGNGYLLTVKGQNFPQANGLLSKPMPNLEINWGYVVPDTH